MRTVFLLWRMQVLARERAGETEPPPLMSVKQVVEIATLGGARVNQLEKKTGSLTPGKEADLIMLATDRINVMPLNNAYAAVVQGMDTSNVDTVFVGGKVKKRRAHPPDGSTRGDRIVREERPRGERCGQRGVGERMVSCQALEAGADRERARVPWIQRERARRQGEPRTCRARPAGRGHEV